MKEYFEGENGRSINLHSFCISQNHLNLREFTVASTVKFTGYVALQPNFLFLSLWRERAIWDQDVWWGHMKHHHYGSI
jgi:hypothetical protein